MRFVCVVPLHICTVLYIVFLFICSTMFDYDDVDLGFNNPIVDTCDYVDYAEQDGHRINLDLTILQLNSRGLLGKIDKLKSLLSDIRKSQNVHVVVLAETWLKQNNMNHVKIPGYRFVSSHRKG